MLKNLLDCRDSYEINLKKDISGNQNTLLLCQKSLKKQAYFQKTMANQRFCEECLDHLIIYLKLDHR